MKKMILALLALAISYSCSTNVRADVLWDNGQISNFAGIGAGGANISALVTGETVFGFGDQNPLDNRMADMFTVGAGGWNVDSFRLFMYQTGSTTTSTITGASLRIFDGNPNSATVVFGSTVASPPAATGWTGVYRTLDSTANATNTQRPIMFADVNVGGLFLAAGTYYVDYNFTGSLTSGPWAPPVAGFYPSAGTALQSISGGVYNPALTGGVQSSMPFIVNGSSVPEPSSMVALLAGAMLVIGRRRR